MNLENLSPKRKFRPARKIVVNTSGCLERYISSTGIVLRTKELLASISANSSLKNLHKLTCKDIFYCACNSDTLALKAVNIATEKLGNMPQNQSFIFNHIAIRTQYLPSFFPRVDMLPSEYTACISLLLYCDLHHHHPLNISLLQ